MLKDGDIFFSNVLVNNLEKFKNECDLNIDRYDVCLDKVKGKEYTRDCFERD